jgi:hypothetical protein
MSFRSLDFIFVPVKLQERVEQFHEVLASLEIGVIMHGGL